MSSRNYDRGYDRGYISGTSQGAYNEYGYREGTGAGPEYDGGSFDYVYGSAAPALDPYEDERQGSRRNANRPAQNGQKARPRRRDTLSPAMIAVMTAAVCIMAVCLFSLNYLQTEVTLAVEEIADLETKLADLKNDNDEALNAIETSISLDDIKYRAIAELGMTYADEDQIIHYTSEESDYVRQLIQPD